jgi:hypothetical protein
LALLFMAASSYPTRSSERARNAATQISTTLRTSPEAGEGAGLQNFGRIFPASPFDPFVIPALFD